ncbi:MAG: hypothetical protein AAF311_04545 [Pseudomonadota bacterium]
MILRRLRAHVEAENWFAVFLDFAIVVLGVFLGLQVQEWAQVRAETERRGEVMQRLELELRNSDARTRQAIEDTRQRLEGMQAIFRALETGEIDPADREMLELGLMSYNGHTAVKWLVPTLDELLSNGELALIDDNALRTRLMQLREEFMADRDTFMHIRTVSNEYTDAIYPYIQLVPVTEIAVRIPSADEGWDGLFSSLEKFDLQGMRSDDRARAALGHVYDLQSYYLLNHMDTKTQTDAILAMFEDAP